MTGRFEATRRWVVANKEQVIYGCLARPQTAGAACLVLSNCASDEVCLRDLPLRGVWGPLVCGVFADISSRTAAPTRAAAAEATLATARAAVTAATIPRSSAAANERVAVRASASTAPSVQPGARAVERQAVARDRARVRAAAHLLRRLTSEAKRRFPQGSIGRDCAALNFTELKVALPKLNPLFLLRVAPNVPDSGNDLSSASPSLPPTTAPELERWLDAQFRSFCNSICVC